MFHHRLEGDQLGQERLGQKKDKPGECTAAADEDGPVPDIQAKKSSIRRAGHEL
jgi:hypothetical protein